MSAAPVLPAASVLLIRETQSQEVLLVTRALTLRFMGGFTAFPGGKVNESDAHLASPDRELTPFHVAAVRELFEETGVLLARGIDGKPLSVNSVGHSRLDELRRRLLAEEIDLATALSMLEARLESSDLIALGGLVTPPFAPVRFDTRFFLAQLPPGQNADVWPGELTRGIWRTADDALRDWRNANEGWLLSPPTVCILEALSGLAWPEFAAQLRQLFAEISSRNLPPIPFAPAVRMLPLDCQGLPPTTHTNTWLVGAGRGSGPTYLIDPGPSVPSEQMKLFTAVDPTPPTAIVLTHGHPDHMGAAALCAQRYAVPIWAHQEALACLADVVQVQRTLQDGDLLDLGPSPRGQGRWHLEVVYTPGHAPDHICLYEPNYQLLFAGDMVSTLSSIIIAPPQGDLSAYLHSLRRLKSYPIRLLLPAHGPVSARPHFVLEEALAHRAKREEQLLEVLKPDPQHIHDLVLELYRGLPETQRPLAELQMQAGLEKLEREGRVSRQEQGWILV